jgi:PKD repeat protein
MKNIITFIIIIKTINIISQTHYETNGSSDNWSLSTAWTPNGIPGQNDSVTIKHNMNVKTTGDTKVKFIDLQLSGILNLSGSLSNQFQIYGDSSNFDGTINGVGKIRPIYRCSFSGSPTMVNVDLRKQTSPLTLWGDFSFRNIVLSSGASLFNYNNLAITSSIINSSSVGNFLNFGTLTFSGSNFFNTNVSSSECFHSSTGNIIWNSTLSFPSTSDDYPGYQEGFNDVQINAVTSYDGNFSIRGNWENNSQFNFLSTGNTITFSGSSQQNILGTAGVNNFKNITVSNPFGLVFLSGTTNIEEVLKSTNGTITQNGSNIILKSTSDNSAARVKISTESDYNWISGDFTVERYIDAQDDYWRMIGSPLESTTLNDWDPFFTYCGFTGSDYTYGQCGNFCSVYFYNEAQAQIGNPSAGWDSAQNISNNVNSENGTIIYSNASAITLSVTGKPQFDDINFDITKSGADAAFGWNLITNPYPSTLSFSTFRRDNNNEFDNAFYILEDGNWRSFTSGDSIPHSQGFLIKKTSTGTSSINMNVGQTIENEAPFTKSVNGINLPLKLKLSSNSNDYLDYCYVNAGPFFSDNYDAGEDIFKMTNPYPDYISSIFFNDNQNQNLDRIAINNNISTNLDLVASIGQFAYGEYTIEWENTSSFMIGSCLKLEDLHNGIITNMRIDSNYTFFSDSSSLQPRFKIHIDVDYEIIVSNLNCFNDSSGSIAIYGDSISTSSFNLLDSNLILIDSIYAIDDSLNFLNVNAGLYNLTTNNNGRCSLENQQIIITEPEEIISDFKFLNDSILSLNSNGTAEINVKNNSTGARFYEWDFGDGNSSNLENPTHYYNSPGIYNVSLTASFDTTASCSKEYSKYINVLDFTPSSSNLIDSEFSISFLSGKIIISTDETKYHYYKITNLLGKEIIYSEFNKMNPNNEIIKLNLNSGIYVLSMYSNTTIKNFSTKFFINN